MKTPSMELLRLLTDRDDQQKKFEEKHDVAVRAERDLRFIERQIEELCEKENITVSEAYQFFNHAKNQDK